MPQVLMAVGAVASVVGTVQSFQMQKAAGERQAQADAVSTAYSNRQKIREAQIKRAQVSNMGAQTGAVGGSGLGGGLSSLSSQVGSGLGFASQMSALSDQITKYTQQAQLWGDIAGLGQLGMSVGKNMKANV